MKTREDEIRDIRNKYIDDSLFDIFRNELDSYQMQLGHNITNALKTHQSWTDVLNTQVWDRGIGQYNKIINDIENLKRNIDLTKEQILCCTTLRVADESYNGIKDVVRIFKSRWVNEEKQLIQDWTNNLLELIQQEEANNPNRPDIPPANDPAQTNQLEQVLKRIQELENLLIQSREENQNLRIANEEKDTLIDGMRDNLIVKDNKISEQSDKIEVQSNKIIELQGKLLDKTEQITVEHDRYVSTKHKIDLVKVKLDGFINNHEGIEDQNQLVEMLGDLNINNDI